MKIPNNALYLIIPALILTSPFPSRAETKVVHTSAKLTDPWEDEFGGGKLSVAVNVKADSEATPNGIDPEGGMIQTFKGDGKRLKAVGFYLNWFSNPEEGSDFKICLIDYGIAGPVIAPELFNEAAKVLFTDPFTWGSERENKRIRFVFSGPSSVILEKDHYYGIVLEFPKAKGHQILLRTNSDVYSDGRLTLGTIGKFDENFFDRDAVFAVYTSEP